VAVYQLQTKFRNEQRATGGLLRVREFLMKDMYSFHASPEDLLRYYEEVKQAYLRVFSRCGLRVIPVAAESGSIGGEISHEFALIAETGEDTVAQCSQCAFAAKREHLGAAVGQCPECGAQLTDLPCIENGHIFQLGIKYSQALNARVAAADGSKKFLVMGCYGIGVGRLLASIVEAAHDDTGICWPSAVSPYDVHVLSLCGGSAAHTLAASLRDEGFDVLDDDREEATAGEKFADSELIGIPAQVIVSERGIRERSVEVRPRSDRRRTVRVAYDRPADIVRAIRGILESTHV
jgi:prolyl-tRNA synthetase